MAMLLTLLMLQETDAEKIARLEAELLATQQWAQAVASQRDQLVTETTRLEVELETERQKNAGLVKDVAAKENERLRLVGIIVGIQNSWNELQYHLSRPVQDSTPDSATLRSQNRE